MILVAACRAGNRCRYHGRVVNSYSLQAELRNIPHQVVCPEMAAGFPCPRPPIRFKNDRYKMVGKDVTKLVLDTCIDLACQHTDKEYFIGEPGSPCCDPHEGAFAIALEALGIPTYKSLRR